MRVVAFRVTERTLIRGL